MQAQWHTHSIEVRGDWIARYLYLAPRYELWIDDQLVDATGGPRLQPKLEALIERPAEEEGADAVRHHVEASLTSIVGLRPRCQITIDGDPLATDRVVVQNTLNPFLLLFILIATSWMIYIGPDVLRSYVSW